MRRETTSVDWFRYLNKNETKSSVSVSRLKVGQFSSIDFYLLTIERVETETETETVVLS